MGQISLGRADQCPGVHLGACLVAYLGGAAEGEGLGLGVDLDHHRVCSLSFSLLMRVSR